MVFLLKIVDKDWNEATIRAIQHHFRNFILRTLCKTILRTIGQFRLLARLSLLATAITLSACSGIQTEKTDGLVRSQSERDQKKIGRVFGGDGVSLFGADNESNGPSGIGVNSFLWRASLDTISFMPLASADPFGGVIITDWYSPPSSPLERFKMTVYILDRKLRADGLKVSVFRQTRITQTAPWNDAAVASTTPTELEDSILTRARQLHVASAEPQ